MPSRDIYSPTTALRCSARATLRCAAVSIYIGRRADVAGISCHGVVSVLRQTVHTHRASVRQAAKLVAALLRAARVTAGLTESNGSLSPAL